jgi:hypothetical protein
LPTDRCNDPELGKVGAHRVAELGSLAGEDQPGAMQHQHALLLRRLHPDEAHGRTGDRFADRLGIRSVVLRPLHVRLHILRRHQPHLMAKRNQLPRPIVGTRAGLHADKAARQLGEERQQLGPAQPLSQHHLASRIGAVNLKHRLRQIDADYRNILHRVLLSTLTSKTAGWVERRPRHQLQPPDT